MWVILEKVYMLFFFPDTFCCFCGASKLFLRSSHTAHMVIRGTAGCVLILQINIWWHAATLKPMCHVSWRPSGLLSLSQKVALGNKPLLTSYCFHTTLVYHRRFITTSNQEYVWYEIVNDSQLTVISPTGRSSTNSARWINFGPTQKMVKKFMLKLFCISEHQSQIHSYTRHQTSKMTVPVLPQKEEAKLLTYRGDFLKFIWRSCGKLNFLTVTEML